MKYLFFRSFFLRSAFRTADFLLSIFIVKTNYKKPRKVLIANIAHMGDFVISIPAINKIIEAFPGAEIGLLCSSESEEIAKCIANQKNIYILRHWKLNRSRTSINKRVCIYISDLYKLVKVLRGENYDLAIDLYPYYPNSIFLLWLSKAKFRIGFASSGLSSLCSLTYNLSPPLNEHITEYQKSLLRHFFKIHLHSDIDWSIQKYFHKWGFSEGVIADSEKYYVFQIGAGLKEKRWTSKYWADLINSIDDKIVMVGKGEEDLIYYHEIEKLIMNKSHIINMINKLDFESLVNIVSKAYYVVAGDSLLTHIAYGLNVPQICILSIKKNNPIWMNKDIKTIFKPDSDDILNLIKEL